MLAGALPMLAFPAVQAQGQAAGVALVIGNSRYQWEAPLPNVRRDAPDIAKCFQAMGLRTELVQDAGREAMRAAVDKFAAASRGANLSAFYFAGHGASWAKDTYLVPIDADLSTPTSSAIEALIRVPSVVGAMKDAANRLLVLDNCRNNPADGWRQLEAVRLASQNEVGVSRNLPPNTLLLFSTAPGRVALDGPAGDNSPFAASLLRQLESPSIDFQALAGKIRRDLLIATQGRQVLWFNSSYQQPLQLAGARGAVAGGRSGWATDPSRIVELGNAYAFAQENGILLPPGLIAYRPASASPDSMKIGSFKYVGRSAVGFHPFVLVVMSVEEKQTAEVVMAGNGENGPFWRLVTGTLSGNRLEFVPRAEGSGAAVNFMIDWKDANSGSLTSTSPVAGGRFYNTRFSRLDG